MRRRLTLLFLLAPLVATPSAHAKQVLSVTACSPVRCVTSDDDRVTAALMAGGRPTAARDTAAGVVLLRASVGEQEGGEEMAAWMAAWEPRTRSLVIDKRTWMRPSAQRRRALADLTRGLGTFPPGVIRRLPQAETELPTARPEPAAPPTPEPRPAPAAAPDGDLPLLLLAPVAALIAAAVLLARRRRPGGTAPRPATR